MHYIYNALKYRIKFYHNVYALNIQSLWVEALAWFYTNEVFVCTVDEKRFKRMSNNMFESLLLHKI